MKILYLAARFPYPPNRGDRLTGYHFVRTMAQRHAVTLVSFVDGREPAEAVPTLARWCEQIETLHLSRARSWLQAWLALFSGTPSQIAYYHSRAMRELVSRLVHEQRFDVVFVQLCRMGPFASELAHPAKVLFLADAVSLNLRKSQRYVPWWRWPGVWWESARMERFEVAITRGFRESWLLSPDEVRALQDRGAERVALIRHGVDESLFDLEAGAPAVPVGVFLGNLSVPHNIDAARFAALEVWPRVRARVPGARLRLVGADAVPSVAQLAREPGVELAGFVPEMAAVWRDAGVMIAPLRYSTGIQNKVLEAMAAGVPVVTTPPVAAAIGAADGVHLRTGATAEALADAVVATLADRRGLAEQIARARDLVRREFSWEEAVRRLETLVTSAAAPGASK